MNEVVEINNGGSPDGAKPVLKKKRGRKPKNEKTEYQINLGQTKLFFDLSKDKESLKKVFDYSLDFQTFKKGQFSMSKEYFNYILPSQPYNKGAGNSQEPPALLFNNLIWLTTKEAAVYLRRSVNAVHTLVSRRKLRARKFSNRLYFKKDELDYLIETSQLKGG